MARRVRSGDVWIAALLPVLVALPYLGALHHGFVWIDQSEIVEGQLIVRSWGDVAGVFWQDHNFRYYHRPFYNLIHSLDRAVWGLDPFGFHLSSLVLHGANTALLYILLRSVGLRSVAAATLGVLWGLHPVHGATVGLIHAKADLFVTTALLVSAILALRLRRAPCAARALTAGSCIAFAVALLTKETAFVVPLLAAYLVADLGPGLAPGARRRLRRAAFALAATAGVFVVFRIANGSLGGAGGSGGVVERVLTFFGVYLEYLRKLVWPADLALADTQTRFFSEGTSVQVRIVLGFAGVIALEIWAALRFRSLRPWLAAFNLFLLPVSQIVPAAHFKAERFLYLPCIAFVGLAMECFRIAALRLARAGVSGVAIRRVGTIAAVLAAVVFASAIRARQPLFSDDETLFLHEVARQPGYREGLSFLALGAQRAGDSETAQSYYERCLEPDPRTFSYVDSGQLTVNASANLLSLGRAREAYDFIARVEARPQRPFVQTHLDYNRAVAAYKLRDYAEAHARLEAYLRSAPRDPDALFLFASSALALHRYREAESAFQAYLEIAPDAPDRSQVEALLGTLARRER